jgi:hypothetical protein
VVDVFVSRQVSVWHLGGPWRALDIACGDLLPYLLPAGGWEQQGVVREDHVERPVRAVLFMPVNVRPEAGGVARIDR